MEENLLNDKNNDEMEIDLGQLLKVFIKNIRFILLSTFCVALLTTLYTFFFVPKKYASEATIFLTPKVNDNGYVDTQSISSNNSLINTYISMIKGDAILTKVADNLGEDYTSKQLKSTLSVTNDTNTQIIRIQSTTTDPDLSKDIVELVVNQFSADMLEILNISNISIIDYAKVNENPVSPSKPKNAVMGAMIGFVVSAGIIFLQFLLDNRLKNKNEAENYLGIPVLAEIPYYED